MSTANGKHSRPGAQLWGCCAQSWFPFALFCQSPRENKDGEKPRWVIQHGQQKVFSYDNTGCILDPNEPNLPMKLSHHGALQMLQFYGHEVAAQHRQQQLLKVPHKHTETWPSARLL